VRVSISGEEVDPADRAAVERVVDEYLNDSDVNMSDFLEPLDADLLPHDVAPARPAGLTDEERDAAWVDYWVKAGERRRAEIDDAIKAANEPEP